MRNWISTDLKETAIWSEEGSVSVEFVLWIPVIFILFLIIADASAAFMAQANMWHLAGDISRSLATGRMSVADAHNFLEQFDRFTLDIQPGKIIAVTLSQSYANIGTGMALSFIGDLKVQVFQQLETGITLSTGATS